jgi:hypothetical protein
MPGQAAAALADPSVRTRAQSLYDFAVEGEAPTVTDSHLYGFLINDLAAQVLAYLGRGDQEVSRMHREAERYRGLLEQTLTDSLR